MLLFSVTSHEYCVQSWDEEQKEKRHHGNSLWASSRDTSAVCGGVATRTDDDGRVAHPLAKFTDMPTSGNLGVKSQPLKASFICALR